METVASGHEQLDISDAFDVSNYLYALTEDQIFTLGLALGLECRTIAPFRNSPLFLDEVVTRWLQGKDRVMKRGGHTWSTLVKALLEPRVQQYGIADTITFEKGVSMQLGNGANHLETSSLRPLPSFQTNSEGDSYGGHRVVTRRPAQQDRSLSDPDLQTVHTQLQGQPPPGGATRLQAKGSLCMLISCTGAVLACIVIVCIYFRFYQGTIVFASDSLHSEGQARKTPLGCTPIRSVYEAFDAVRHDVSDWKLLGYELGVSITLLERISNEQDREVHRLKETLRTWYDDSPETACWEVLIQAIFRARKTRLAKRIADYHGVDWKLLQ